MTGICGHIPGVTCSNCHSAPRRAVNYADNEAQVRWVLGMGSDLRDREVKRMPEVSLEWNANDEGPPCIDFTCLCGHWQHLCDGPDWITEGHGQAPGVECVKCGTAWSLYRVQITAMIREEAEPDPLDKSDHRDRVDRHGNTWQRVHEGDNDE
jgi:hypothetical protein